MTSPRLIAALFATALLLSGNGVHAEVAATTPPLNLTLPRDAVWSGATGSEAGAVRRNQQSIHLPDPAAGRGTVDRGNRLPYGSGYEARQRGNAGDQGMASSGRGHGRGGYGRGR